MSVLSQLRLKFSEWIIKLAIIVMAPREGAIWWRHYGRAQCEAWRPYHEDEDFT
jgi:hypothetical protein